MKDNYITTEHLFLGLLEVPSVEVKKLMQRFDIEKKRIEEIIREMRKGKQISSQDPEMTLDALNKYGKDLTQLAHEGKLDPVI
jgi:ATP-dependent Clp protease ATP-binding subunit ClpB